MKRWLKIASTLGAITAVTLVGHPQVSSQKKNGSFFDLSTPSKKLARAVSALKPLEARASGGGAPTVMDSLRDSLFLVIGYPSQAVYDDLTGGNGPPQEGLLGAMNEYMSTVETAVAAAYGSCDNIPSSGTLTAGDFTVTFQTPLRTSPTGFTAAGETFEKRIKFEDDTAGVAIAVEFMCEDNMAFVEIDTTGDTIPNSTRKLNVLLDGQGNTYEVYMAVDSGATLYDAQLIRLETDPSTETFEMWVGSAYTRGSANSDYPSNVKTEAWRAALKGNYSTGETSVYFGYEAGTGYGANSLASVSDTDTAVSAAADNATNRDFQALTSTMSAGAVRTGCFDFDTPTTNPSSTAYCSGMTPSVQPAWGLDSAKAGSISDLITLSSELLLSL